MDFKPILILVLMVVLVGIVAGIVLSGAEPAFGNVTDEGEKANEDFDCVFENTETSDKCVDPLNSNKRYSSEVQYL